MMSVYELVTKLFRIWGDITWVLFVFFFFFNDTATTEIYTLSLHDALPIYKRSLADGDFDDLNEILSTVTVQLPDVSVRSGGVRSEEHTSELQSRETISYAVFCLKKKNKKYTISCKYFNIHISTFHPSRSSSHHS